MELRKRRWSCKVSDGGGNSFYGSTKDCDLFVPFSYHILFFVVGHPDFHSICLTLGFPAHLLTIQYQSYIIILVTLGLLNHDHKGDSSFFQCGFGYLSATLGEVETSSQRSRVNPVNKNIWLADA